MIYDVGMYDGADTAYYLSQGHCVVAVEADPEYAEAGRRRFASDIEAGRLTLIHAAIAPEAGVATFWICDDCRVWSSFDRAIAGRRGARHHPVEVPAVRFRDILSTHGVPLYLKIDIEGLDELCVQELDPAHLPPFLSLEAGCAHPDDAPAGDLLASLHLLAGKGYRRFKLIDQVGFRAAGSGRSRWSRTLESAAHGRLRVLGLAPLARPFCFHEKLRARTGWDFRFGSSGPWGDGADGPWHSLEAAERLCERILGQGTSIPRGYWYDWHAAL